MGRIKNIVSAKIKGNTGAVNFRKRSDAIVVGQRSYTNAGKAENATATQRIHRLRWCNVVEIYNSIKPILQRSWQGPVSNLTSWNRFTKANLKNSPVFLTKKEAELHAAVIAPYLVSSGQLSPIKGEYGQGRFLTNIKIGAGSDLPNMSVADFAAAVVAANDGWKYGDKLSVCRMTQLSVFKGGVEIPKISANFMEISLDPSDYSLLSDQPWWDKFAPILGAYGDMILSLGGDAAFGIHSRLVDGLLLVSTQDVVLADPENPVFVKYSSEEQLAAAMDSYGYRSLEPLVEPNENPTIRPQFFDYIENDGLAYINTNFIIGAQDEIQAEFAYLEGATTARIFGDATYYNQKFFLVTTSGRIGTNFEAGVGSLWETSAVVASYNINHILLSATNLKINNEDALTFTTNFNKCDGPCLLFGVFYSSLRVSNARFYYFQIYRDGILQLSLRPCTYDGVPGMWDEVSETFFGNAADEGAFTVGNLE